MDTIRWLPKGSSFICGSSGSQWATTHLTATLIKALNDTGHFSLEVNSKLFGWRYLFV